jgi:hypothetical protein
MSPTLPRALESFIASLGAYSSILALIVSIAVIALAAYFGRYLQRKGEAKAKSEDFAPYLEQLVHETRATEGIKSDLTTAATKSVEQLKAELAHNIEHLKGNVQAEISHLTQVFTPRLAAYRKLWEANSQVSYGGGAEITTAIRERLYATMTDWYYQDGNGIFLSQESTAIWLTTRAMLRSDAPDAQLRDAFSDLRASLKDDIGVYGPALKRLHRDPSIVVVGGRDA